MRFKAVVLLTQSEPFEVFADAQTRLEQEYPGVFSIKVYDTELLDKQENLYETCEKETLDADFILMYLHGTVTNFLRFDRYRQLLHDKKVFFHTGMEEENTQMAGNMNLFPNQYQEILRYYLNGDRENIYWMFMYLAGEVFQAGDFPCEKPTVPKWHGIYDGSPESEEEEKYLKKLSGATAPVIGILIHWNTFVKRDLRHVDALLDKIKSAGGIPYCVYSQIVPDEEMGFGGIKETFLDFFMDNGKVVIDVLLNLTSFSVSVLANPGNGSTPQETSIFEMLDVPVFQVMVSSYSYEEYIQAAAGIHPYTLTYSVFQPEYDGQLITYPIACTEKLVVGNEIKNISVPIQERVEKVVRLAMNWGRLSKIPAEEKKIAIIFHNLPPRNDMIGCASGLDSPESVYRMVKHLEQEGILTEYDFGDGQEIIKKIIEGVTNDGRWSNPDELLGKSIDWVDKEKYLEWFQSFPSNVRQKMKRDWGNPPGDYMTAEDRILIPGILNGNVFIGLQPPRSRMEKAEEEVHATDLVCPHQYIGFYRWIAEVFQAHAVVHVGTHGTLEWLPGKEVGLSEDSYPDLAIDTLPNLYPFIISNPGEGVQAKRRSYCALLDYLIPSMTESGTYEELADLDSMMKEYYHFMLVDKDRVPGIARRIWELAVLSHITDDLELTEDDAAKDLDGCIDRIHGWVSRIQSQEIADGLHIYGETPKQEQFRNLMKVLLRVKNGEIPSLRDGLARASGNSLKELLDFPANLLPCGKTNAMVLEELDETGRQIFIRWQEEGYTKEAADRLLAEAFPDKNADIRQLKECLFFAAKEIKPRIEQTTREMDSLLRGYRGKMVPTGMSGCPTRGNAELLPTGKNFYTVDPSAIPSRSAWETGVTLAEQLLDRYQKEEGQLPENISVLVYATEAMRTTGDDIAEILYLYGLKPVWLGNSDRVIGLEVIPVTKLGRPRIDVTLRITGLFRDTFPNLIERIEDAVNLVAALPEPGEDNFVKKHIEEEMQQLMQAGTAKEQAFEKASLRIFGDPPGTYGAGVKEAVYARQWKTTEDLGDVFTTWSCHGYGRKLHGEAHREDFIRRFSKVDVTVKNESNIESDMLGSDDFFNYFGGLIAAVTAHSGSQKPAFLPSTANKEHLELFSLHEEASKIMRARVNNPKWIKGLKRHGYKGAQEISAMVDIVFGWDATTNVIDNWMYDAIANRYALDRENAEWIAGVNVFAMQNIVERLLEAAGRGMWDATEEMKEKLRSLYMEVEGDIEELNDQ